MLSLQLRYHLSNNGCTALPDKLCIAHPSRLLVSGLVRIVAFGTSPHSALPKSRKISLPQSHHPVSNDQICRTWRGMQCTDHPNRSPVQVHRIAPALYIDLRIERLYMHVRPQARHHLHSGRSYKALPDKVCIDHPNKGFPVAIWMCWIHTCTGR